MPSISPFWCAVARLVKGKAARLRASRIRLEMTMSDSGPVPFSHSPVTSRRLSRFRFIRGFLLSEQVSDPGGLFVGFGVHGLTKALAQLDQFSLAFGGLVPMPRHLPHVLEGAV